MWSQQQQQSYHHYQHQHQQHHYHQQQQPPLFQDRQHFRHHLYHQHFQRNHKSSYDTDGIGASTEFQFDSDTRRCSSARGNYAGDGGSTETSSSTFSSRSNSPFRSQHRRRQQQQFQRHYRRGSSASDSLSHWPSYENHLNHFYYYCYYYYGVDSWVHCDTDDDEIPGPRNTPMCSSSSIYTGTSEVEVDDAVDLQRKLEMYNSMLDEETRAEQARKQHQYYIQCECEYISFSFNFL